MRRILSLLLALLLLALPGWARQKPFDAATLLGKTIAGAERTLGRPRHVDGMERFYKVEGFVRVVVTATPGGGVGGVVFQFAPGSVKGQTEALSRIGLSAPPDGWSVSWFAEKDSPHDDLILTASPVAPTVSSPGESFVLTRHFRQRLVERGVSEATAQDVLRYGQRFYDPKNDSQIRWKDGVYIALTRDGVLKTVIRGPIERRWRPL